MVRDASARPRTARRCGRAFRSRSGFARSLRPGVELADACRARVVGHRQVADEGEVLAVQAAGGQRQHQRAGTGQRIDRQSQRVGVRHQRSARVGHGGQARLRQQADVMAVLGGAQQRRQLGRQPARLRGSSTIDSACSGAASGAIVATRLRKARAVFAFSTTQWVSVAARWMTASGRWASGQRAPAHRSPACWAPAPACLARLVGSVPSRGASGSRPAARSMALVRISGSPISAVGSSDSIASTSAMPSVSHLALPAQS